MTRRVLVTGSRSWVDTAVIRDALGRVWGDGATTLVVGACPRGADALAEQCWRAWGGQVERHPADWRAHGRSAGFRRNEAMVAAGADACVAFIRDDSPGASHTAALAERAGIPTRRHAHPTDTGDIAAGSGRRRDAGCGVGVDRAQRVGEETREAGNQYDDQDDDAFADER